MLVLLEPVQKDCCHIQSRRLLSRTAQSSVLVAKQFRKFLKHDCFWFMGMLSWNEDQECDDGIGNIMVKLVRV